jgi:hypothetical protein
VGVDAGFQVGEARGDALERSAQFGLGRYLYSLTPTWVGYDAQRRSITPPEVEAHKPLGGGSLEGRQPVIQARRASGASVPRRWPLSSNVLVCPKFDRLMGDSRL